MTRHHSLIAVVVLVVVAALMLPAAPADAASVRIIRDEYGVPHVYSRSLYALWYGVGYASAQDRLWQADLLRRLGTGTSAEYFGASAVEGDILARVALGSKARREALVKAADKDFRTILEGYAAGINAWIAEATATGQLPVEYPGLGFPPPRPFTTDDLVATAMALLQNFGESGADEFDFLTDLQRLVARLGADAGGRVFFDSHWLNDPGALVTIPASASASSATTSAPTSIPQEILDAASGPSYAKAAARYRRAVEGWRKNASRAGLGEGPASNAIAIGPELSASGRPLLLHGPQMGYTVPQINHEMGIHGAGFDVTGMTIAGIPGIPIGVTKTHAWTWTTGGTDNQDLYLESINPDNPAQYRFGPGFRNLDCRPEQVNVAGGSPVQFLACETVHGPVVVPPTPGSTVAFSLKTAVRNLEVESMNAVLDMSRARSYRQFKDAVSRAAYNFNVLYADARKNIAYWHAGRIPIRAAGDSPWFPHIGAGIAEWQGFIPFKEMPHVKNPAQGWLANWNNKPRVNWFNSRRGFSQWGPVARVRTLQLLLERLPPGSVTTATIQQINQFAALTTDQPSGNASTVVVTSLLGDLLGAVDPAADARLPEVLSILAGWNLLQLDLDVDGRYDSPAVAIFNTWWQTFINRVFADELGSTLERNVVANMAGRLLRPGSGLPLLYNYLGGETVEQAVTGALIGALDALTSSYGSASPADWLQPAAVINWSPIGAVDVPDIPWMNRGTYNQITHLGKASKMAAVNVIAPGQSGNPLNPHFADQLLNYATFRYKPMRLTRADLTGNRESTLVLTVRRSNAAAGARSSFEATPASDEQQPERPRAPSRDRK